MRHQQAPAPPSVQVIRRLTHCAIAVVRIQKIFADTLSETMYFATIQVTAVCRGHRQDRKCQERGPQPVFHGLTHNRFYASS